MGAIYVPDILEDLSDVPARAGNALKHLRVNAGETAFEYVTIGSGSGSSIFVNVKDAPYGAVGDGVADDSAAIQAAIDSITLAGGGTLYFPTGNYLVSTTLTTAVGMTILGDGFVSKITTNSPTNNILNVTVGGTFIERISFSSSVTRTAGDYVWFDANANHCVIRDFKMTLGYRSVHITAAANVQVSNGIFYNTVADSVSPGSSCIYIDGGNDHFMDTITADNAANSQPTAGLHIVDSGNTILSNVNFIHCGDDLLVNPGSGQGVASIWAINCGFDTAKRGINISPTGNGQVIRNRFDSCWTTSHTIEGVRIAPSWGIKGIEFIGLHCGINAGNGISILGGTDVRINGGWFAQNGGDGINVSGGVNNFSIQNIRSGPSVGLTANSGYGINIASGASDHYVITGNDLHGNLTGALLDNGTGVNKIITNNLLA